MEVLIFRLIGTCVMGTGCALPVGIAVERLTRPACLGKFRFFLFQSILQLCSVGCVTTEKQRKGEDAR